MHHANQNSSNELIDKYKIKPIQRIKSSSITDTFWNTSIYDSSNPVIINGFKNEEFGGCIDTWSSSYFIEHMGDTEVSIHLCNEPTLSFSPKNFTYKRLMLKEFFQLLNQNSSTDTEKNEIPDAQNNSHQNGKNQHNNPFLYFRSLSSKPTKRPANIEEDFPEAISKSFRLPQKLQFDSSSSKFSAHSSILRIAQPGLQLWTHYDIPDNFLIQVIGTKRVFIFPPEEVMNLYITGSSSPAKSINVNPDLNTYPYLNEALKNAQWADLAPGDILFIPSCWPHCIWMKSHDELSEEEKAVEKKHNYCISANVFFQNSERKPFYEVKDIYGNKDFKQAQSMITKLESSVIPEIKKLPEPFSKFYLLKMASILISHAQENPSQ